MQSGWDYARAEETNILEGSPKHSYREFNVVLQIKSESAREGARREIAGSLCAVCVSCLPSRPWWGIHHQSQSREVEEEEARPRHETTHTAFCPGAEGKEEVYLEGGLTQTRQNIWVKLVMDKEGMGTIRPCVCLCVCAAERR